MNLSDNRLLWRYFTRLSAGLFLILLLGCGGSLVAVPVEGTITIDGKPLAEATISLTPTTADGPGPYLAASDQDGRFAFGPPGKDGRGAEPGRYFLSVTTVVPRETDEFDRPIGPPQKEIVPIEYSSGTKEFTVPEGGTTEANFELTSGGRR
jgi:hypothetical protein